MIRYLLGALLLSLTLFAGPKRALVTGGAGFVGSHLCDRLIQEGYEVICFDNLYTGSLDHIQHLLGHSRFSFIEGDVSKELPLDLCVEEIYNLACPASPVHYQKSPVQTIRTSVFGMIHVLELALRCKAKVFQASTSEVYGDPLEHPQRESYWGHVNPIGIRACYDEGKRCAETLCFDYHREYGVIIKVGRIFNTYGPRMRPDDGRVVSNFILQALRQEPLTVYGEGQQTRSFCYVSDLVEAIFQMMQTPDEFTGPVNLGNPSEWTMLQLAEKVLALTESNSSIDFLPLPQDDPKMRLPVISLAEKMLQWKPRVPLEEGLKNTIEYFKAL